MTFEEPLYIENGAIYIGLVTVQHKRYGFAAHMFQG